MKKTINDIMLEAQEKFWEVVAREFPEIETGDFGIEETIEFNIACKKAIGIWLKNNQ